MSLFKKEYLSAFLENQGRLFDEPVANTPEEADDFLVDCMAEVVDSIEEVRECLDGFGMDMSDLTDEELADEFKKLACSVVGVARLARSLIDDVIYFRIEVRYMLVLQHFGHELDIVLGVLSYKSGIRI